MRNCVLAKKVAACTLGAMLFMQGGVQTVHASQFTPTATVQNYEKNATNSTRKDVTAKFKNNTKVKRLAENLAYTAYYHEISQKNKKFGRAHHVEIKLTEQNCLEMVLDLMDISGNVTGEIKRVVNGQECYYGKANMKEIKDPDTDLNMLMMQRI